MRETEDSSRNLARYYAQRIENQLGRAAVVAETIAGEMEDSPRLDPAELQRYLHNVVARHRFIYGSCIAFEPNAYLPNARYFAPYYYWKGDAPEFVQLGNPGYDYFKWEWYEAPKAAGYARWSEPYYDEGGGETVMTTYSVPFRRDGKFWGIATIDIAMNELTAEAEKIKVGVRGYAFIISKAGRFLAHPDRSQIMKVSLFETNPWLAQRMTSGQDGFVRAVGPWKNQDAWVAYVPIKTGNLSFGVVYPVKELNAEAAAVQFDLLTIGIIGLIGLAAMLLIIVLSVSRPVASLADAARQIAAGDLDVEISPHTQTLEIAHLSDAFRKMTGDLKARLSELREATAAQERSKGELAAARLIQSSILPVEELPGASLEFEINALLQPAREVGGDFYHYHFLDREWLCLLIGDVSGKGVPAALFMAVTVTLLKAHSAGTVSPARIMGRVNRELCRGNETGMFVTVFCALLNIRTGALVYCNAGHPAPWLLTSKGAMAKLNEFGGPALGAVDEIWYENAETRMRPGDSLFAYTDGVSEAVNWQGEFYGEERLSALLQRDTTLAPARLAVAVLDEVGRFSEGMMQADDISVLAVRYLGRDGSGRAGERPSR